MQRLMNWAKKNFGGRRPDRMHDTSSSEVSSDRTASAVAFLMHNQCDMGKCLQALEQEGLSRQAISRICNVTIIACGRNALAAIVPEDKFPAHYVLLDQSGVEHEVRFDSCEIYRIAQSLIPKFAQDAAVIGAQSDELRALNWCMATLGDSSKESVTRVEIGPPKLPLFGPAQTKAFIKPALGGTSLSIKRRVANGETYFRGNGIDVGGGHDCIAQYADLLGFDSCRNWDFPDGDAQYLAGVLDGSYDFLYSSHCLEHMVDPKIALVHWVRVIRPGGYIVVSIPDEEMYEHLHWPSTHNNDHKWSFTIYRPVPRLPKSLNVFDLLMLVSAEVEIIKLERIEAGYRYDLGDIDQTALGTAECSIEFVLRKI